MAAPKKKRTARKGTGKAESDDPLMFAVELEPVMVWSFEAINGSSELTFKAMRSAASKDITTALVATLNAVAAMKKRDQKKILTMFEAAAAGARFVSVDKDGAGYICQADEQMLQKMQQVEREIAVVYY